MELCKETHKSSGWNCHRTIDDCHRTIPPPPTNKLQFDRTAPTSLRPTSFLIGAPHIHDMLESTDLLDIKQRIFYNTLMLIYRAQNNMLPEYLCSHFRLLNDSQPYQLRRNHHLRPPPFLQSAAQNSFIYKGALLYNDMVKKTGINASASEPIYRKAIKGYVKMNTSSHRTL